MKNLENRRSIILVAVLVLFISCMCVLGSNHRLGDAIEAETEVTTITSGTMGPNNLIISTITEETTIETTTVVTTTQTTSSTEASSTTTAVITEAKIEEENSVQEEAIAPVVIEESKPEESEIVAEVVHQERDTAFYFYKESMRVHTAQCIYTDKSSMERIESNYIDEARRCTTCNPSIEIGTLYVPEEPVQAVPTGELVREYVITEMTYYKGSTWTCCGARGTTLTNNYSCASNYYPFGTILYIKSADGSVDGYYEVEDTGGMGNNVVDIYYNDYSLTPYSFRQWGRVPVEVWVVK